MDTPKNTASYPHRLLKALDKILSSSDSSVDEKLQAARLMLEAFEHRTVPRKKTDKEKAVIAALQKGKKKEKPPENGGLS